jgi:hypothetical protein
MALVLNRLYLAVFRAKDKNGDKAMNKIPAVLMFLLVLTTVTAMIAVPALAQLGQSRLTGARCGTYLIQIGKDTKSTILKKCGRPTTESPGRRGGGAVWTYNRGSGKFMGILRFTGPTLTAIEKGDHGFAQPIYQDD